MSRYKRRKTHRYAYWGTRRHVFFNEYITPTNQDFIQNVIKERFQDDKPLISPLKEEPLPREEWKPRCHELSITCIFEND